MRINLSNFYFITAPRILKDTWKEFLLCALFFLGFALLAFYGFGGTPKVMEESLQNFKELAEIIKSLPTWGMSFFIFLNNAYVSLVLLFLGIAPLFVGALFFLIQQIWKKIKINRGFRAVNSNSAFRKGVFLLGSLVTSFSLLVPLFPILINGYMVGFVGRKVLPVIGISFWKGILPHGILELPIIFLMGGLSLKIAFQLASNIMDYFLLPLVKPEEKTKSEFKYKKIQEEFLQKLKEGFMIYFLVAIPLLLLAGFIEGYISASFVSQPSNGA